MTKTKQRQVDGVVSAYVRALNQILNTTVSASRLTAKAGALAPRYSLARYQGNEILPLELKNGFWLLINQEVTVVKEDRDEKIVLQKYLYRIWHGPMAGQRNWLLEWHLNRQVADRVKGLPHVHVNCRRDGLVVGLPRLHVPTDRISLERILLFMIDDLGLETLVAIDQARGALLASHAFFMRRRRY